MKPDILMTARDAITEERLGDHFTLHFLTDYPNRTECLATVGKRISGLFYAGTGGRISDSVLERMPCLEIVSVTSSGYDFVDVEAARVRGITVTNAGGANAVDTAEFAFGLLIDAARNIHGGVRHVQAGLWPERPVGLTRRLSGHPLGILGLGHIGLEVARRAEAFGMPVYYHNRRPRLDLPFTYVPDALTLARQVELMVVATPGGPETHHMIDRKIMDRLGPEGVLVNVGRGSTIDTAALIAALSEGTLGAAALDVLEGEPKVPPALLALPNAIITPHQASLTRDAMRDAFANAAANLEAHFAGMPVLSPVN